VAETMSPPPQPASPIVEAPGVVAMPEVPQETHAAPPASASPSASAASGPRATADIPASPSTNIAALSPSSAPPGPITQSARPRGGYQVRPTYPAAAQQASAEGTTMAVWVVVPFEFRLQGD
jgi:hypothetical protein